MDTIEQRVIIPASPTIIWNIVSQLDQNPTWQVDCRRVQFVGPKRQGRGTRWRQITANGQEQLFEITAWYDEVGYEYRLVEGAMFDEIIGRIKMHETPDGTVVHWEFQYTMGGFMSGLRNSLITRRNLDNMLGESLWALWEISNHAKVNQPRDYVYRSMMRDAPDVEQRANYVMREHSTQSPTIVISEPPVAEDDTRPNEAVKPQEPERSSEEQELIAFKRPEQDERSVSAPKEKMKASLEAQLTAPELDAEVEDSVESANEEWATPLSTPDILQTEVIPRPPQLTYVEDVTDDTSEISVFDLFGVDRPVEAKEPLAQLNKSAPAKAMLTDDRQSLGDATPAEEPLRSEMPENESAGTVAPTGRRGLRAVMRRKLVDVQRPAE